jgi:NADPH2:quinone reductase
MPDPIPTRALQLRTLVTTEATVELSVEEVEVPAPGPDEVLVRVEAAPVNPSDLGLLLAGADLDRATSGGSPGRPAVTAPLPAAAARQARARVGVSMPAGNEGAGTVVAAGDSPPAQALLGRLVAVAGGGMYAQYRVAPAAACLPLPADATAADGASSFVNPMTALGMVETLRSEGHTALVHTAAASNLGRMLNRICQADGVPLVNVVRSAEQARLLRDQGAAHVCDSSTPGFTADLEAAVAATSATLAFDAIGGGALAGRILEAMEAAASADEPFSRYGSTVLKQVYIYGGLDRGPTELSRSWGMAWSVGGWLLPTWLGRADPQVVARMRQRVAAELTTTFASSYAGEVSLTDALRLDVLRTYARMGTGQKHLLLPQR